MSSLYWMSNDPAGCPDRPTSAPYCAGRRNAAEVASRDEALSILTSLARDGRVSAAIALARELREGAPVPEADELTRFDELARRGQRR
jgi:hypothetical protein